ncbi:MAG: hypothetical protein ABFD13_01205 [Candidatus Cryosericum sp.]
MLHEFCAATGYSRLSLAQNRNIVEEAPLVSREHLGNDVIPECSCRGSTNTEPNRMDSRLMHQLGDIDPLALQRNIGILEARLLRRSNHDIFLRAVTHKTISL